MSRLLEAALGGRRWGIYARLSKDREGSGLGVERQVDEVTKKITYIDPSGVIVDIYIDNDMSASKKKRRPDYERMIADLESGRINAFAVWHIDRLTRRNAELERIVDLVEATKAQFACVSGDVDLGTYTGRMVARILGAVSQGEVEHKAERQKAAYLQRALEGKAWGCGVRRYGYDSDGITIRPEEQKVVRHMVEHVLKGGSVNSLVTWLGDNDHRTSQGNRWASRAIVRLLLNPAMAGHRTYGDEKRIEVDKPDGTKQEITVTKEKEPDAFIVARDCWPAIITDDERRRLRVILKDPDRTTNPGGSNKRKYLLSGGILICGLCGRPLTGHRANSGLPGYHCRKTAPYGGCAKIRIAAGPLELDVASRVLARYASPVVRKRLAEAASPGGDVTLGNELADLEEKLEQLGRDYADPMIPMSRGAFLEANKSLAAQVNDVKGRLKQAQRSTALPEMVTPKSLAAWWAAAEIEERRGLILTVIDHIVVHPSTRPGFRGLDKDRLTYVWR
ncbi:recombinase family protein [Nonomuraea sp. NEAU-A123]|uniref:recombinase family protein n=1 Tax=Nonomuraea sp. NEAU-A123 TaxID=2839649 RepID=UPI001BE45556|nr:recombinase family protein [Nonomuraea sp. NEAU-A123]MBT2226297.1 recombinase family protein [Nonomuraea sp. NEAU-A123]